MPAPRSTAEAAARDLARRLVKLPTCEGFRVVEVSGRVACMVLVWDAAGLMPTLAADRRARGDGKREECKAAVLAAVRAAGRPLTAKELTRALKEARAGHGPGTVAKALADLTAAGRLVNTRDKRGYRLPEWARRDRTPSLF